MCEIFKNIGKIECDSNISIKDTYTIQDEVEVYKNGFHFGVVKNIQVDYIEVEIKSKNKYLNGQIMKISKLNK